MDIGAFGKGKGKQSKGKHGKGKGKGKARTARNNADRTGTRATGQEQGLGLNVGIVEDVDTTRKIVGSRRTPKVVRRENTNPRVQMLTILSRNHQLLNQKLKLTNST